MTDEPVALGFQIELEFGNVGFLRTGANRSIWGKNLSSKDENQQQTQLTYDIESVEIKPGPHSTGGRPGWEASALTWGCSGKNASIFSCEGLV